MRLCYSVHARVRGQLSGGTSLLPAMVPRMGLKLSSLVASTVSCWPLSLAPFQSPFLRLWSDYMYMGMLVLSLLSFTGQTITEQQQCRSQCTGQQQNPWRTQDHKDTDNALWAPRRQRSSTESLMEKTVTVMIREASNPQHTVSHLCNCCGSSVCWGSEVLCLLLALLCVPSSHPPLLLTNMKM